MDVRIYGFHIDNAELIALSVSQVSHLKKDLLSCSEERDSAQLDKELLSSRLKNLESEMETKRSSHTDHSRELRQLEVSEHVKKEQGCENHQDRIDYSRLAL